MDARQFRVKTTKARNCLTYMLDCIVMQMRKTNPEKSYRKIPKISPRAYIFQRPFSWGLFLEGLTFGGAYLRREICVSKLTGLAL